MHYETDVLIVGSGPSGSASAALLSTYGVRTMLVSRFGWLADTPRAHITNQRTMEVLRDLGLEEEAVSISSGQNLMANNVFCYSLAGEEFGRILSWGNHPLRKADYELASPTAICDIPQTYMEPILFQAASKRGAKVRMNSEFLSLEQDAAGVTATIRDRLNGETYTVRAKYLIGADGARSTVADAIALPMEGKTGLSASTNVIFECDLTRHVQHRPSVLYWVLQPGSNIGGIGAGVLRMVRPWHEWQAIWGVDLEKAEAGVTVEEAETALRQMIGDADIPLKVKSTAVWTVNNMYAANYSVGRVFCMGDAVHKHPPLNGLGSNTCIQDAFNLCWKLAAVLKGQAGEALLDTYSAERQPVGKQIVTRANRSIEDYPPIFEAVGLLASPDASEANRHIAARKAPTPEGKERRRKLYAAIERKNYEFNTHGVEMGQRYRGSAAVVSDGTQEPAYTRDPELYFHPTTWPGARLPHVWVEHGNRRVSTLDLCGHGRFTLLTGIGGEGWVAAAKAASEALGLEVAALTIGPSGCDAMDIYADWYRACEIEEDGCILVRPDHHVAWRAGTSSASAEAELTAALKQVLARA
ncbi:FAD-dependent monooxygenase [Tabrizicola sp.]|uniref:FAD-dependent monooxygenase n=1 Tax=Tabrizicola sp. TaxID=2005166 RepID=UPI0035AE278F